ncbi:MAG: hypothetical protein OSJ60_08735 [Lachnospiraceae bacterium]|nr:hypothetical protein [Lachnospiraceae bacterium]
MNFGEAKKYSRDIVAAYFGDSHVFYAEQKMAKRTVPYLTVKFNGLGKVRTKITKYDRENQCFKDYWQANTKMELNLYTLGKNIAPEDTEPVYENTAVEDMDDFVKFLCSDEIIEDMDRNNIVIAINGRISDLSYLENSSEFRYRSMAEFDVNFIDSSHGMYGQNAIADLPNPSGGGTKEMIADSSVIENVEVKGETK